MMATIQMNRGEATQRRGGKFLTFYLANEEYGLEILKVQEILGMMPIARVPRIPGFIRGVINLRGKVIPIVDLRLKFGMEQIETTPKSCIIVVQTGGAQTGIVVDRVSEVLTIADEQIEPAPAFGDDVDTSYILGIGKAGDRVRILLDIDHALADSVAAGMELMRGGLVGLDPPHEVQNVA